MPPFATPRAGHASPREDGEVGETAQDVLDRHPCCSPQMATCIDALKKYESVMTPGIAKAVGRLLSAALSPLHCKAEPEDAKEALQVVATKMLPERACKKRKADEEQARALEAAANALAATVERENRKWGERRLAKRVALAEREPPTHREVDRLLRVHMS